MTCGWWWVHMQLLRWTSHFMRECKAIAEYGQAGKCKCSADGKLCFPGALRHSRNLDV